MALCESQLDSALPVPQRERDDSSPGSSQEPADKKPALPNGDVYGLDQAGPLSVDYRSPVSHFVPPAVELYALRQSASVPSTPESSGTPTPIKRKRGRPRIDKTSPEYLANLAARKQAREMAAVMNNRGSASPGGEKRKRGRPRVDKTSPEYLARKRAREIEALERKAIREHRRRTTGDSAASSSGESPRVKRKYTKRTPSAKKNDGAGGAGGGKGRRGRPRKADLAAQAQPQIRVRSNLMPAAGETITLDSDDEPDLGSPSQASDSLSLDENLKALRHIHEKYANIDKDELYSAHLLAANFKKPAPGPGSGSGAGSGRHVDDDVLSVRSSEGSASVKELDTRVEKLEDSSNSDSDTSSSSGSSSSNSSSSSSSSSSSDSDSDSDNENDKNKDREKDNDIDKDNDSGDKRRNANEDDSRSFGAWSYSGAASGSGSGSDAESDPERAAPPACPREHDDISESDTESADKAYQCHICRKWYSTRVTLKIHRRSHQRTGGGGSRSRARASDRYECDCCELTFGRREKLWEHRAVAHRGSMTVRCDVCRRCFEDDSELAAHTATHTADDRAGRCATCGATFPRWEQLRRHRAAHSAAPALPHACAQCGKRFTHPHSLARHLHNHAKQLYRCVVCKASFARADQLAQHLNSHLANYKRLKP